MNEIIKILTSHLRGCKSGLLITARTANPTPSQVAFLFYIAMKMIKEIKLSNDECNIKCYHSHDCILSKNRQKHKTGFTLPDLSVNWLGGYGVYLYCLTFKKDK